MAVQVPEPVREAWGDEAVKAFIPWLDEILAVRAIPRDEYRQVLSRLDLLEKDVALIKEEQIRMRAEFREELGQLRREMYEQLDKINQRFDRMNERFDRMESHMGERFDTMYDRMLIQSRWLVGSIALFGTVISILLAIGQFIK